MSFIAIVKTIILPPAINFAFIGAGLFFKRTKVFSRLLLYVGSFSLVLFCLPIFSSFLLKNLEKYPALNPPVVVNDEKAIVVLSGGSYADAKEFAKDTDGSITLQRNYYASFLYNQTGLPVLVTGGALQLGNNTEAAVMKETLENSFNVNVKWQENKSRNTAENAIYSVALLKDSNIDSVYLVTHAWHMPRSVMMFEQQGISVTPAPTVFTNDNEKFDLRDYIPSASALYQTRIAMHEYIGILWYKLRYN
ncbi:MAG: YdcF family protein [Proteobacteria bacterium]|nr:YdcF family protein [Pseudomonadota bacterium]